MTIQLSITDTFYTCFLAVWGRPPAYGVYAPIAGGPMAFTKTVFSFI